MRTLILSLVGLLPPFTHAQTFYYEKPAILHGKLLKIKSLHLNQKKFGNNQIALVLDKIVEVEGDEGVVKTKLIQWVDFDEKGYSTFFNKEGKPVMISCKELFRAHTGHHTTKVLCIVDEVKFNKK